MLSKILSCVLFFKLAATGSDDFIFTRFHNPNLSLGGQALVTSDGLLVLTNNTTHAQGQAFYSVPIRFKQTPAGEAFSFSTTFVFAITPEFPSPKSDGFTFALSPAKVILNSLDNQYLGLFNSTNNGKAYNHIVAVEFDTVGNPEMKDIDDNHVGLDINGLVSIANHTAGYFRDDDGEFELLNLASGEAMQVWVEYEAKVARLNVTLSPFNMSKPITPLLSLDINLSSYLVERMYVGFTASTGPLYAQHNIMGWSFAVGSGGAHQLDLNMLPIPPKIRGESTGWPKFLLILVLLLVVVVMLASASITFWIVARMKKFEEVLEDWEVEFKPQRISYKDLFVATKGFVDEMLVGVGGFGRVYRGVMPNSSTEVAVKRLSDESRQGLKEFIAEVVSLGHLHHRNLVQLHGYCRRRGELFLIYDFMHNGSLDKYLFKEEALLGWERRFKIIKDVAAGLLYLHEDGEHLVIHRDVKAGNVLLDSDLNGKLGDFGLARLYNRGTELQTTHVVGTIGYLAPELSRTGKASTATDVYSFGAFLLEVACGRRPVEEHRPVAEVVLVDWVRDYWRKGQVIAVIDEKLRDGVAEEMEMVLKLGLICLHPTAAARPSMRQVKQILDGEGDLDEMGHRSIGGLNSGEWCTVDYVSIGEQSMSSVSFQGR